MLCSFRRDMRCVISALPASGDVVQPHRRGNETTLESSRAGFGACALDRGRKRPARSSQHWPPSVLRISMCNRTATTLDQSDVGVAPAVVDVRYCSGEPSLLVSNAYSTCRLMTPSASETIAHRVVDDFDAFQCRNAVGRRTLVATGDVIAAHEIAADRRDDSGVTRRRTQRELRGQIRYPQQRWIVNALRRLNIDVANVDRCRGDRVGADTANHDHVGARHPVGQTPQCRIARQPDRPSPSAARGSCGGIGVGCQPKAMRSATFHAHGDVSVKTVSDGGKKRSVKAGVANIVPDHVHCKAAVFDKPRYAIEVGSPARCAIEHRCQDCQQTSPIVTPIISSISENPVCVRRGRY